MTIDMYSLTYLPQFITFHWGYYTGAVTTIYVSKVLDNSN